MNESTIRTAAIIAIAVAVWLIFLWGTGTIG